MLQNNSQLTNLLQFGRPWPWILTCTPAILNEDFHSFPQFVQADIATSFHLLQLIHKCMIIWQCETHKIYQITKILKKTHWNTCAHKCTFLYTHCVVTDLQLARSSNQITTHCIVTNPLVVRCHITTRCIVTNPLLVMYGN